MQHSNFRLLSGLSIGLGLLLLSRTAFGNDPIKSEGDFLGEMPVVLTASRILQSPLDAPAPVTVIDKATIEASGFTELQDIFRLVPGFLVTDWPDGPPIVVNHGMGDAHSFRLLVLLDGHALYDPFQGGVDWQDLPLRLEDIERIEVVRGPNPASYGANAFQGVINIISRVPLGERERGLLVRAGTRKIGDLYAYMAHGDGRINWRLSASAREATNFRDLDRPGQQDNEAIQRQTLNGQLIWNPRSDTEVSFRLGLGNGKNKIGQVGDSSDPVRSARADNLFVDAGWKHFYADNSEVSLRYFHYGRSLHDDYRVYPTNPTTAPMPWLDITNDIEVRRDDIEFQQIHAWSDNLTGLWGAGLRKDSAESPNALAGLGNVGGWQGQVFGNLDWTVSPKWLVHLGGMVEKHYNTDLLLSPRLALNYRITPNQSMRISFGRGYRAPTIYETNAREIVAWENGVAEVDHLAYRNLEPERLDYAEIGYIRHLHPLGLRLDARVFYNKYDNIIDEQSCILDPQSQEPLDSPDYLGVPCGFAAPAGYERPLGYSGKSWNPDIPGLPSRYGHYKAFYFFNAGNIRVHGGDLGLDWQHADWGRFRLSHAITRISASGVGSDLETNPGAVTKDLDIEMSAPHHSTSLLWSKKFPGKLHVSLAGYWVGALKWPNDGDLQDAYRRFDARIGKRLGWLSGDDELSLTLQNFNPEHSEFHSYLVERRAFLTYRVDF